MKKQTGKESREKEKDGGWKRRRRRREREEEEEKELRRKETNRKRFHGCPATSPLNRFGGVGGIFQAVLLFALYNCITVGLLRDNAPEDSLQLAYFLPLHCHLHCIPSSLSLFVGGGSCLLSLLYCLRHQSRTFRSTTDHRGSNHHWAFCCNTIPYALRPLPPPGLSHAGCTGLYPRIFEIALIPECQD